MIDARKSNGQNGRYVDKKDDKWTEIRPSKGSNAKTVGETPLYVFETERENGTPDKIRTCDLLLRRQALYPAELRAHIAYYCTEPRVFRCTNLTKTLRDRRLL